MRRLLIATTLIALAAGCQPRPKTPGFSTYLSIDRHELLQMYNDNAAALSSLSADLKMTFFYVEKGRSRDKSVSAWLDVEKPSRLRLVHDSIGREFFCVVSNGERFHIGLDHALTGEDDVVYTGAFGVLPRVEGLSFLRPDLLLKAFALPPLPPTETSASEPAATGALHREYPDRYVLAWSDPGSGRILAQATFSRVDLALSTYEVFDDRGRIIFEALYKHYSTVDRLRVPDLLLVHFPFENISVLVRLSKIRVAQTIDPRTWTFRWRDDVETIELEAPPQAPSP